jgi:SAM-dependent methyltransferase
MTFNIRYLGNKFFVRVLYKKGNIFKMISLNIVSYCPNKINKSNPKLDKISFGLDLDAYSYDHIYRLNRNHCLTNGSNVDGFILGIISKNIKVGSKILDIGAGEGRNAIELAKRGYKITAYDISTEGLKIISEIADTQIPDKKNNLTLKKGSILSSFNETDKFDLAYMVHVSQYFGLDDIDNVFKKMNKSLNNNGIFVFDVNLQIDTDDDMEHYSPINEQRDGTASFSEKQILDAARKNGFELVKKALFVENGKNRANYEKMLKKLCGTKLEWCVFRKMPEKS